MKKLLLIAFLSGIIIPLSYASSEKNTLMADYSEHITMVEVSMPSGPSPRMPLINAWIVNSNMVYVYFSYLMGPATVEVIDFSGFVLYTSSCDTNTQESISLNVSLFPGTYTLRVTAKDYESKGDFNIH